MKQLLNKLFLFSIFIFLAACSLFKTENLQKRLIIYSTPSKATVTIYNPVTQKKVELGKTPLKINLDKKLPFDLKTLDYLSLEIKKPGHVIEHILLDKRKLSHLEINTKLKKNRIMERSFK